MGALYKLDFPNGKSYIGMTTCKPVKRFKEHFYSAKRGAKTLVSLAIQKHGAENVVCRVLVTAEGREYLSQIERDAIRVFGTRSPDGYNQTDGGDGAPLGNLYNLGKKRSSETKARMSLSAKEKPAMSEVTRLKIAASLKGNIRSQGQKQSAETKAKRSRSLVIKNRLRGVTWDKQNQKWRVTLGVKSVGRYTTRREAEVARQHAVALFLAEGN